MQATLLKYFISTFLLNLLACQYVFSQKKPIISGFITDAQTGERLNGATIYAAESQKGTTSNSFGFFSLTLPSNQDTVIFRFVGYEPEKHLYIGIKDTTLNIALKTANVIGEVVIKATSIENNVLSPIMGINRITAKNVEKIPSLLGEADLLKTLQLLPGVSFAKEGSTGFSVRGGSPDQTLILLDGVPVYNVNHLWGFMSLFNNDAISNATLFKGSMPARFGGRLSSVLDIQMKEGNLKEKAGTFTLSPVAGRYTIEFPLSKNKSSLIFSTRKTWIDIPIWLGQKLEGIDAQTITYGFWDINAKANWIIDPNNRIYLSFYTGRDAFNQIDGSNWNNDYFKFSYNWQNLTSVLRWNHVFNPRLFVNLSAYNSRFKQEYISKFSKNDHAYYKGYNLLNDYSLKGDFDWYPEFADNVKFGYILSAQQFSPDIISLKNDTTLIRLNNDVTTSNFISDIYADGNFILSGKTKVNVGFRLGLLSTQGKNYASFHPRISTRYLFSSVLSAKISWSRMNQYLHQLQNSTMGIPTELWVSSTRRISPGVSDLFSAGLFFNTSGGFQLSGEAYYSLFRNILQYRTETLVTKGRNESWENFVTIGDGRAYGLELMAEKSSGNTTGWISYTLSKSVRQFDEINYGKNFPFSYDRRHQIHIFVAKALDLKIKNEKKIKKSVSANFNFASGNFVTLATQEYQGLPLPLMGSTPRTDKWYYQRELIEMVNNYQMPDFHHMNLSYQIERQRKGKSVTWNFSVYNVYNRLNPWYYYKKENQIKQVSMFPIIPSVSYTYKW